MPRFDDPHDHDHDHDLNISGATLRVEIPITPDLADRLLREQVEGGDYEVDEVEYDYDDSDDFDD